MEVIITKLAEPIIIFGFVGRLKRIVPTGERQHRPSKPNGTTAALFATDALESLGLPGRS